MDAFTEKLTLITRNFPAPIRELGVSLIDEKCYVKLIEQLDFSDIECLKLALSKGLGIGIVIGGSIVKVPQIALSESLHSRFLEGPNRTFFLGVQNTIVSLLIILHGDAPNPSRRTGNLGILTGFFVASISALYSMSLENLGYLQLATLPLSLFSKIPQITANYKAKSTGQLSAFAVLSQIIGCAVRVYTTSTEVGDPVVQAGFGLALFLNVILGIQMMSYWGNIPPATKKKVAVEKKKVAPAEVELLDETLSQDYFLSNGRQRRSKPMQRVDHAEGSSRKWERKVD
uniref:Mannose-P-dolichol utilization defect 1 protein homolog n=1 Tax=Lentinula edodes TaxID=5353 RepID=V9M2D1_LENED|nr:hypothetical protein [Lentinula edodes]AGC14700.1 hypothetical protein [Lentinula edodes]